MADSNNPGGLPPPPPPMGGQRQQQPESQPNMSASNSSPVDEQQAQDLTSSIHDDPQMPSAPASPPRMPQAPPQQQSQPQAPPSPPQQTPPPQPSHHDQPSQPNYQSQPMPPPQSQSRPETNYHDHPPQQLHSKSASGDISTEEYVEAVIEERWADIENDIRKVVEWKNRSDQRINALSQQFDDLKDRFDKLHAALIGKIESYDKNILEVGAELKAMEKVFSKVMPNFTENVKQLDDLTRRLK